MKSYSIAKAASLGKNWKTKWEAAEVSVEITGFVPWNTFCNEFQVFPKKKKKNLLILYCSEPN